MTQPTEHTNDGELAAPAGEVIRHVGRPQGARTALTRQGRQVHLGHFAFMRAVVQGLPVRESYQRYLQHEEVSFHPDRVVSGTIRWLREELGAAARKQARHGRARLIELDLSQIPPMPDTLPSLEDWALENGWDGFSEREILEAYQAAHAHLENTRAGRRARLIEKQLSALRWLEELIAQAPGAGDACAAWLSAGVAQRLAEADIFTLAQLIERINGVGRLWHRPIQALGPVKARRIEAWLREHQASIGLRLGGHVEVARSKLFRDELDRVVAPATEVRPLEKFRVPAELDGRAGRYRQPQAQCLLAATNDYDAILAWIKSKHALSPEEQARKRARRRGRGSMPAEAPLAWLEVLSHTQRACRKEAERFLLWAILERGKPLSSMTTEDCVAYRDFLANPQPTGIWCGPRSRERWSPLWRPFEGPLSVPAQHQAVTILKNLYSFLVNQNYLMGNPWVGVAMPRKRQAGLDVGRSFTRKQWQFVMGQVAMMDANEEKSARLAFALGLLYATGLRLSEAVNAKVGDLTWVEYPAGKGDDGPVTGWELRVVGKGDRIREVVVSDRAIELLRHYLRVRGLTDDLNSAELRDVYLLGGLSSGRRGGDLQDAGRLVGESMGGVPTSDGISASSLYAMLKKFFGECAGALRTSEAKLAQRFERASTHWLRHTHASHAIAGGVPIEVAQASLGHASLATTTAYVTTEKARRMRAILSVMN
ncbi:MAG: phage integrase family protein [Burkholderiaceae bacterium]